MSKTKPKYKKLIVPYEKRFPMSDVFVYFNWVAAQEGVQIESCKKDLKNKEYVVRYLKTEYIKY